MTISPDKARPGPAGHNRGRSTKACNPSVIAESTNTAPTTGRSQDSRMRKRFTDPTAQSPRGGDPR